MATFYTGVDKDIYESGVHYRPQQKYLTTDYIWPTADATSGIPAAANYVNTTGGGGGGDGGPQFTYTNEGAPGFGDQPGSDYYRKYTDVGNYTIGNPDTMLGKDPWADGAPYGYVKASSLAPADANIAEIISIDNRPAKQFSAGHVYPDSPVRLGGDYLPPGTAEFNRQLFETGPYADPYARTPKDTGLRVDSELVEKLRENNPELKDYSDAQVMDQYSKFFQNVLPEDQENKDWSWTSLIPFTEGSMSGNLIRALLPKPDSRFVDTRRYYGGHENLDSVGRIKSGLMAGYSPVSGNALFGNQRYGLQRAYQKRLDMIRKTLARDKIKGRQREELEERQRRLQEEKAAELRMLQESQRKKDFKTIEKAYEKETGQDSGYSGGEKTTRVGGQKITTYHDPFDPGGGEKDGGFIDGSNRRPFFYGGLASVLGREGLAPGGPAGGASAGGDYGGNVNPEQEYAGSTFEETYGDGGGGGEEPPTVVENRDVVDVDWRTMKPEINVNLERAKYLAQLNLPASVKNRRLEAELAGTIGPVDFSTMIEGGDIGDTKVNVGNWSADLSPNADINQISYNRNIGGWDFGANYAGDGSYGINLSRAFKHGGLASIL